MEKNVTGVLRQQAAFIGCHARVVIKTDDNTLPGMEVVEVYPDTVNEKGQWESCFTIKVQRIKRGKTKEDTNENL